MLDFRLKAYDAFVKMPIQDWGPDLSTLNFDDYTYYIRPSNKKETDWDEVPETIKDTFDRLGIPEAEQKFLAGVNTQYESETVYHNMLKEVEEKGVIFLDTDSALQQVSGTGEGILRDGCAVYRQQVRCAQQRPCGRAVRSSMSRKG